jgi:hypothetical protein
LELNADTGFIFKKSIQANAGNERHSTGNPMTGAVRAFSMSAIFDACNVSRPTMIARIFHGMTLTKDMIRKPATKRPTVVWRHNVKIDKRS